MDAGLATAADQSQLDRRLSRAGFDLDDLSRARLAEFVVLLEKWNRVYNLIGACDRATLLDRHIVESLALGPLLHGSAVADVGSGAGLPGLPLAIAHRERHFTLIESRRKRVNFMRHVIVSLGLENVIVAHGRAEALSSPEPFATVLARAVAAPAELLKVVRPLTTAGSVLVLLTSAEISREIVVLADDFVSVELPAGFGSELKSSVVVLERTGDRTTR